ncbi:MAG: aminotransferase class V-fold PLP-dependent enzyme [Deltaproteobacteria bacterium]|nr:aminotransferase class V-fold PLP-dependent enzyme [Deltaproteobacteria bacterium]
MSVNPAFNTVSEFTISQPAADARWAVLDKSVRHALETCANVHRGSGHASVAMTSLFEAARKIVCHHLGVSPKQYEVIFCTSGRARRLAQLLPVGTYRIVSSDDAGLSLGVHVIAVRKSALPKGKPAETGGGTTRLIGKDWTIWAPFPDRYEPGTPAIINIVAFARALALSGTSDITPYAPDTPMTPREIMYGDNLSHLRGESLLNTLLQTRIGKDDAVPSTGGDVRYIHLDHSAGTPTFEPVYDVFRYTLKQPADVQDTLVDYTRQILARVFGAPVEEYQSFFTGGTTEAVYLAAQHLRATVEDDVSPVVVNTLMEHSSNDLPWRYIPGCRVIHLDVDDEGIIDTDRLQGLLSDYNTARIHGNERIVLVSVSGASNVLGTCNDLSCISALTHKAGASLFVDAAQLAAHRTVSMSDLDIDYLAFSGHKMYAPFGSGALIVRKRLIAHNDTIRQLTQGTQTQNAAGIAAMGKALLLLDSIGLNVIAKREAALVRYALQSLGDIPGIRLYGITDPNSPKQTARVGVIPFDIKNNMPASTARDLMLRGGIGVRYGCHCAHMLVKQILHIGPTLQTFQRVLQHIIPPLKFQGVIRISFGLENTREDVDRLVAVLRAHVDKSESLVNESESIQITKQKTKAFVNKRHALVYGI